MQHLGGARKRERSDAPSASSASSSLVSSAAALAAEEFRRDGYNRGDGIEHELKRLRLAKAEDERGGARWPSERNGHCDEENGGDVDMDAGDMGDARQLSSSSSQQRVDYRPINLMLRECHYLRQLRKFQSERVSYLERRAPTDAAAAAVMHAMHAGARRR